MSRQSQAGSTRAVIVKWEIVGFVVISVLGSLLHFVFDWLGQWRPAALIAAVNESVWEHLKMAFWPALSFYAVQLAVVRERLNNAVAAATAALYLVPTVIAALFYSYTAVLGRHVVAADVTIFLAAVSAGQVVHHRLITRRPMPASVEWLSAALLIALVASFSLFTFWPPDLFLFRDPVTGCRGLP